MDSSTILELEKRAAVVLVEYLSTNPNPWIVLRMSPRRVVPLIALMVCQKMEQEPGVEFWQKLHEYLPRYQPGESTFPHPQTNNAYAAQLRGFFRLSEDPSAPAVDQLTSQQPMSAISPSSEISIDADSGLRIYNIRQSVMEDLRDNEGMFQDLKSFRGDLMLSQEEGESTPCLVRIIPG